MKLTGRRPKLSIEQATLVRARWARRCELMVKTDLSAEEQAELAALPNQQQLADEHGCTRSTISNTVNYRNTKFHTLQARQRQTTQEQPQC